MTTSHEIGFLLLILAVVIIFSFKQIFVWLRESMIETIARNAQVFGHFCPDWLQKSQYWFGQIVAVSFLTVLVSGLTVVGLSMVRR